MRNGAGDDVLGLVLIGSQDQRYMLFREGSGQIGFISPYRFDVDGGPAFDLRSLSKASGGADEYYEGCKPLCLIF